MREIACRDVATLVGGDSLAAACAGAGDRFGRGLWPVPGGARGASGSPDDLVACVGRAARYLATSRPTAVNLFWALARMERHLAETCAARRRP